MRLLVVPMELEDIPQVLEVDRESYTLPWPASAYRREILHNRHAHYLVLREAEAGEQPSAERPEPRRKLPFPFVRWPLRGGEDGNQERRGKILGYAGMWLMIDEAHITTIAIRNEWRGRGLGELLLISLLDEALEVGAHRVTLEVRVSNDAAQRLYAKYGFQREGLRPRYYSDNNEDAYIMTTSDVRSPGFQDLFTQRVLKLRERLDESPDLAISAPGLPLQQEPMPRPAEQA